MNKLKKIEYLEYSNLLQKELHILEVPILTKG